MKITPTKLNRFLMFKLPAAYLCGVRVAQLNDATCKTEVTYKWINQNPYKSMFWAVQGMAAELSTGALVNTKVMESGKSISTLVLNNNASFTKKAVGKITFVCNDGQQLNETISKAIATGAGQTVWMRAEGTNEAGVIVSTFNFEWTLKVKN